VLLFSRFFVFFSLYSFIFNSNFLVAIQVLFKYFSIAILSILMINNINIVFMFLNCAFALSCNCSALFIFYFFIKCMQFMTMTLSRRCVYAKLHVIWSKSLLYIFSLINHIDSLCIQALLLKLSQLYFCFPSFLRTLRVLLFRF